MQMLGLCILDPFHRKIGVVLPVGPVGQRLKRINIRALRPVNHIHRKLNGILYLPAPVFSCRLLH